MEKSLPQNPILTPEIFSSVVFGQVTKLFWVCIPNSKMPERVEFSFEKQKRKKEKKETLLEDLMHKVTKYKFQ